MVPTMGEKRGTCCQPLSAGAGGATACWQLQQSTASPQGSGTGDYAAMPSGSLGKSVIPRRAHLHP